MLTAAGIALARRWMRRLEQRAQAAYPDPDREDTTCSDPIARTLTRP
jgi:hypothetical protein